ncbi:hypothetical protein TrCOL_g4934 [Triparma columacea]|uniref:Uncharacterized protein n=1 Tax=Triparma columacea TaxID=722753 RepID=A0A9W7L8Y4_9STRA|nr:hypothetical protein TrCOL_g4934 [Triparma columacea]
MLTDRQKSSLHVGLGHRGGGINKVSVHPIFELAATAGEDGTVKLWDLDSGDFVKTLKGHTAAVTCVVWNAKGDLLVSTGADLSVKVWDGGDGYNCRKTMRGHGHNVSAASFCRMEGVEDKGVVTTGRDGTIRFWDLDTGFCVGTIQPRADPPVWLRDLKVGGGGGEFATAGSDGVVTVWDLEGRKVKHDMRGHEHVVNAVAYPGGATAEAEAANIVVSASRDKTVRVWDTGTGAEIHCFRTHSNWVRDVLVSPRDHNYIISVGDDRSMVVFDLKNRRCVREIKDAGGHFVQAVGMHKKLPVVVTAGVDNEVRIWKCE